MRSRRNERDLKKSRNIYNILWGKNSSILLRVIVSLLFGFILAGIYFLWLFGTSRLEIELQMQKNDFCKVYFSDGKPLNEKNTKTQRIQQGKHTLSFIIFTKKIKKIRFVPTSRNDEYVGISKFKISNGFTTKEISFADNKPKNTIKKIEFWQLRHLGNGNFLTTGSYPFFSLNLKDIPEKRTFPFLPAVIIIVLSISFFLLPGVLCLFRMVFCKIELLAMRITNKTNRLLHDYPFWFYVFAIILLGWGFELFNFTLTYDDELMFVKSAQSLFRDWLWQKRWGMAVVALIAGNLNVPVIPLAITLFCYSLSFCILFYNSRRNEKYYIFPIYAVFPLLFQSFSFSSLNPGIGIAFLMSALSVYLINKRSFFCFLLAIMAAAFAIGSYEIFAVFIVMAAVCWWLQRAVRHDFFCSFRYIRYTACKFICFAAGCFLLNKAILYTLTELNEIKTAEHIARYVYPIKDFSLWFNKIADKIGQYWSGSDLLFPKEMILQTEAIGICLIVIVFFIVWKRDHFINKILLFCGLLLLLVAPFSPNIFHQYANITTRVITILFPLGLVSLFHLTLVMCKPYRLLRIVITGLLIFISIQYLWIMNQNTYIQYLRNKLDLIVITKLQNRISSLPEFALKAAGEKKIPLVIIGNNSYDKILTVPAQMQEAYPNWHLEINGLSCLGDNSRAVALFNIFGYPHYERTNYLPDALTDKYFLLESMPMWPLNGAIAFFGNYLVIKLSDHLPQYSKPLNRKLLYRNPFPINGLEELMATRTDKMRLLHSYQVNLKDPRVKLEGKNVVLELKNKSPWFYLPARKFDVPYVILEISAEFDQADRFCLWNDQKKQWMQFAFSTGLNNLKVRCPSYFLNKPFSIGFGNGSGKVNKVLLKEIKVYEDAEYTENLIRLNPELNKQKLMEILHE